MSNEETTKVTITLTLELTKEERDALPYTLMDSFYEVYSTIRRDAHQYVANRYPSYNKEQRAKKIEYVNMRNTLATKLHSSVFNSTITED